MQPRSHVHRPMRLFAWATLTLALAACSEGLPTGPGERMDLPRPTAVVAPVGFTGDIRIGVIESAALVKVGADGNWTLAAKGTGATLLSGTGGTVDVTLQSASASRSSYRLQVACSGVPARDAFLANATGQGYATFTEFVPGANCWRLFIGDFAELGTYSARVAFKAEVVAKGLAPAGAFWKVVVIPGAASRLRATRGADVVYSDGPMVLTAANDGLVRIGTRLYRGRAEVGANSSAALAGINELPLEEYLYGVVPRELSPNIWPEVEALKAQAVAARTYAMRGLGKRRADGYDLFATVTDQVYGGFQDEHPVSNRAVDETAGIVATYQGRLIEALFYSTSGGFTANNEESFASAPVPYLRAVPDAQRGNSLNNGNFKELTKGATANDLRKPNPSDFESGWSTYHRWTFDWTPDELRQVLSAWQGRDVGKVLAVNDVQRGPSGRLIEIEFATETGSYTARQGAIRSALRSINTAGSYVNLPSTLFFIEPTTEKTSDVITGWTVWGGGFGHGVGMSQTGAVGQAEKGRSFREILFHYYRGIALETLEY